MDEGAFHSRDQNALFLQPCFTSPEIKILKPAHADVNERECAHVSPACRWLVPAMAGVDANQLLLSAEIKQGDDVRRSCDSTATISSVVFLGGGDEPATPGSRKTTATRIRSQVYDPWLTFDTVLLMRIFIFFEKSKICFHNANNCLHFGFHV